MCLTFSLNKYLATPVKLFHQFLLQQQNEWISTLLAPQILVPFARNAQIAFEGLSYWIHTKNWGVTIFGKTE
jgi:hypothetical protein